MAEISPLLASSLDKEMWYLIPEIATHNRQYSLNDTSTNIVTKNAIRHVGDTVPTILSLMSQTSAMKQWAVC